MGEVARSEDGIGVTFIEGTLYMGIGLDSRSHTSITAESDSEKHGQETSPLRCQAITLCGSR